MHTPFDAFTQLNDDVLVKIFEELRPEKGLRDLSSTCRWLRAASTPILFSSCCQYLGEIPWEGTDYEIFPPMLWSHIRTLNISCHCIPHGQRDPDIVDPLICGPVSALEPVLPALPHLTTLYLHVQYIEVHGLSWNTMRKILSLPHLCHLHIDGFYICPELLDGDNLDDATVTPLTTFHYTMPDFQQPWSFPSEVATLDFLVCKLHTSLQTLTLPVESAPIQTISSLHWPSLRQLTLRGERWTNPATPIVTLFSSMPSLRSLALKLSELENAPAGVVWPKGVSTTFPWPDLADLRVSHPDPHDEVYTHLPLSLRSLALRSWPHECERVYLLTVRNWNTSQLEGYRRRWWSYPLSTPHNLAEVLRQCNVPRLRTLDLEYREDAREPELLQLVVTRFPHLTTLEIHRFRREGRKDVPVRDVADVLAPLASLHTLKLHLDFAHMPFPDFGTGCRGISRSQDPMFEAHHRFDATLASTADAFARALGSAAASLEEIWMYTLGNAEPAWIIFGVTRAVRGGEVQIGVGRKDKCWYRV